MCIPVECCLACYVAEAGVVIAPRVHKICEISKQYLFNPNHSFGPDPRLQGITVQDRDGKPVSLLENVRQSLIGSFMVAAIECIPCIRIVTRGVETEKIKNDPILSAPENKDNVILFGADLVTLMNKLADMEAKTKSDEPKTD